MCETDTQTTALRAECGNTDTPPRIQRVSPDQVASLWRLHTLNPALSQDELAHAIGVSQGTVSNWLQALDHDTRDVAKQVYDANQLRVAQTVLNRLDDTDGRVALKAAEIAHKVSKVLDDAPRVQVGVQVVLGMPDQQP